MAAGAAWVGEGHQQPQGWVTVIFLLLPLLPVLVLRHRIQQQQQQRQGDV
jgi:hypothetical protein